jgi:hypothetical protein
MVAKKKWHSDGSLKSPPKTPLKLPPIGAHTSRPNQHKGSFSFDESDIDENILSEASQRKKKQGNSKADLGAGLNPDNRLSWSEKSYKTSRQSSWSESFGSHSRTSSVDSTHSHSHNNSINFSSLDFHGEAKRNSLSGIVLKPLFENPEVASPHLTSHPPTLIQAPHCSTNTNEPEWFQELVSARTEEDSLPSVTPAPTQETREDGELYTTAIETLLEEEDKVLEKEMQTFTEKVVKLGQGIMDRHRERSKEKIKERYRAPGPTLKKKNRAGKEGHLQAEQECQQTGATAFPSSKYRVRDENLDYVSEN